MGHPIQKPPPEPGDVRQSLDQYVRRARATLSGFTKERTIARDLVLGLSLVVVLVFLSIVFLNSVRMFREESASLSEKSNEIINNLADVLVSPVWNLNQKEIDRILDVYQKFETLAYIELYESDGKLLSKRLISKSKPIRQIRKDIYYQKNPIGFLKVGLSGEQLQERQRNMISTTLVMMGIVLVTVAIGTFYLIGNFLDRPLKQLLVELDQVAKGNYNLRLKGGKQKEIRRISRRINKMAQAIASREKDIERHSVFKTQLATEIEVAETIQRSLLPNGDRVSSSYQIAYYYKPVMRVGGDWFTYFDTADSRLMYMVMGDVTGHGLPQGLVTTAVMGCLQTLQELMRHGIDKGERSPAGIIRMLDGVVDRIAGPSNLMMTCVALVIDFERRNLIMSNAGHTFPLVLGKSGVLGRKVRPLTQQQPILGSRGINGPKFAYIDVVFPFLKGERLLLYTDGLTDANNGAGATFQRRFMRLLKAADGASTVNDLRDEIVESLGKHVSSQETQDDDICFVLLEST